MSKLKIFFLFFITSVVLASCSKEDGDEFVPGPSDGNNPPEKPVLTYPVNQATDMILFPNFKWKRSNDPDKDRVTYVMSYSTDQVNWISTELIPTIAYMPFKALKNETTYYWKVTASDGKGGESVSDVYSFKTGKQKAYADGESWLYTGDETMNGPIPIIFTGDGFLPYQFVEGELFDKKVNEGIQHFFSVEPYKSLRQYFTVYKLAAHSQEEGISRYNLDDQHLIEKVNTVFNTRYYGNGYNNTQMKTDDAKVYSYAKRIEGITDEVLAKTTIVLIANAPTYSGTCWWQSDGRTISIVPTCDGNQPYSYQMTMVHEAGGHGFGHLADEYLYENRDATQADKNGIIEWSNNGYNDNIDVTNDRNLVKWKHFFGVSGYGSVDCYAGAQFLNGVWMPENVSAMRDMRVLRYNAPSREAIVKRICKGRGVAYDFEEFKRLDQPNVQQGAINATRAITYPELHINHTPPQYGSCK